MKKRFLLCLLTLMISFAASAYEWTDANGTVWSFIVDGNNAILEEDEETACVDGTIPEDLIIPTFVYRGELSYTVTSIGNYAFYCCSALTSVTIPSSVTYIGDWAFYGCSALASVTIPSSVTGIDGYAFYGCSALTSVTIPNTVTYIDERAFAGCSALTSVNIPSSVMGIGPCVFLDCSSLTSVTIPSSVTAIGNEAFMGCSSLTNIYVDSGNGRYDSRGNCNAIIETATNTLLFGCKNTTIPSSVTIIGNYAFWYCSGLTSVTIPSSVIYIGHFAFDGCSDLTSVTIPSSVRGIDIGAFQGCSGLTSVTVDLETPLVISPNTFNNCYNATLYVPVGSKAAYQAADYWKEFREIEEIPYIAFSDAKVKALCVANWDSNQDGEIDMLEAAAVTDLDEVFSGNRTITSFDELQYFTGLTSIDERAFSGCSGLTSVTIPSSVTSIGESAFESCSGLSSVTIPSSVTSIGVRAFYDCRGLTSVIISEGVTSIGYDAFLGCESLINLTIPSSVKSIGDSAFGLCSSLSSITVDSNNPVYDSRNDCNAIIAKSSKTLIAGCKNTIIPSGVTSIGAHAFYGCDGLTSIVIPSSVTSIGEKAFISCSSLSSITVDSNNPVYDSRNDCNAIIAKSSKTLIAGCKNTIIPSSVTSIGPEAFWGCDGLTSIAIPSSVTSIGYEAFGFCDGLTSIAIPSSVTSIGFRAFEYCRGLTSVIISEGVTSIGRYAFDSCESLINVTIPSSVTSIGERAFSYCKALTSVTVARETPLTIPENTFSNRTNATLFVPDGSKEAYEVAVHWREFKNIVEPNILSNDIITFADSNVKALCVANWDTDGDGELSEAEAAVVTDLGTVFESNRTITSFNELQFFMRLTSIGRAFDNCSSLLSVTLPSNVMSIGNSAFSHCSGLTSLIIPENVTKIGSFAFYKCSGLTSITIPSSVTSIDVNFSFAGCSGLTNVKVDLETPLSISSSTFTNRANATLVVPIGSKAAYQAADYWKEFKRIIEFVEGDVNGDEDMDVVDVVDIARYVVGTPAETFVPILADIDNSGEVNIGDAVALVNEIAGDQNFVKAMRAPRWAETTDEALRLMAAGNGLSLILENQRDYTAFQFDLFVPEGTDVAQMLLNAQRKQKHQLLYNKVEEGHYRVAALSTSNHTFQGNDGELLSFAVSGGGDIAIRDIHFFTADGGDYTFEALYMNYGAETGIGSIENEIVNAKSIYDLNGRKMVNGKLPQGIYIMNGKKVFIK